MTEFVQERMIALDNLLHKYGLAAERGDTETAHRVAEGIRGMYIFLLSNLENYLKEKGGDPLSNVGVKSERGGKEVDGRSE